MVDFATLYLWMPHLITCMQLSDWMSYSYVKGTLYSLKSKKAVEGTEFLHLRCFHFLLKVLSSYLFAFSLCSWQQFACNNGSQHAFECCIAFPSPQQHNQQLCASSYWWCGGKIPGGDFGRNFMSLKILMFSMKFFK